AAADKAAADKAAADKAAADKAAADKAAADKAAADKAVADKAVADKAAREQAAQLAAAPVRPMATATGSSATLRPSANRAARSSSLRSSLSPAFTSPSTAPRGSMSQASPLQTVFGGLFSDGDEEEKLQESKYSEQKEQGMPIKNPEHAETIKKVLFEFIKTNVNRFDYDKSARKNLKDLDLYQLDKRSNQRKLGVFFKEPPRINNSLRQEITGIINDARKSLPLEPQKRVSVVLPANVNRVESKPVPVDRTVLLQNRIKDKTSPDSKIFKNTLKINNDESLYEEISAPVNKDGKKSTYHSNATKLFDSLDRATIFSKAVPNYEHLFINGDVELYKLRDEKSIKEFLGSKVPLSEQDNIVKDMLRAYKGACFQSDDQSIVSDDYLMLADRMVQSLLNENGPNAKITVREGIDPLTAQALMLVCAAKGLNFTVKAKDGSNSIEGIRNQIDYENKHKNKIDYVQDFMGKPTKDNLMIVSKVVDVKLKDDLVDKVEELREAVERDQDPNFKKAVNFVNKIEQGINLSGEDKKNIKDFLSTMPEPKLGHVPPKPTGLGGIR
ncbi:MAG: hypothetical protein P4M12_01855, partial [Gammaproteobacteria bacterium]|nr:hypothetical protein [Gammaproteobacteria bacterium]